MQNEFRVDSPFAPSGDQPTAIAGLVEGIEMGLAHQTLLGVTGSGKTYTIAKVIEAVQRPTIVITDEILDRVIWEKLFEFTV